MTVFCIFKCFKVPLPLVCIRLCDLMELGWWNCVGKARGLARSLLWQWGIVNSSGFRNVFLSCFGRFFFFLRRRAVWGCKMGDGVSRMCSSQVGNCDIENACERVDIWCLWGGIEVLKPDGTVCKDVYFLLPDPVISNVTNVLLWIWKFESDFLKVGQTLCIPDLPGIVNKTKRT